MAAFISTSSTASPVTALDHAHLMDRIYAHQRHIYDVTRAYYLLGRNHLIRSLDLPKGATVLEIGCGTGRNLIAAAKHYPDARFFGFDISSEMLRTAEGRIARRGLSSRIRIMQGDATNFSAEDLFGRVKFDAVFISYSLSMMPEAPQVIANALACLKSNARLHIVDFGRQEGLPAFWRPILYTWLDLFHVHPEAIEIANAIRHAGGRLTWRQSLYRGYAQYFEAKSPRPGFTP
jgi:S-adenosylmethionine-diacylgycerolhomoserine-N-methlytransferase